MPVTPHLSLWESGSSKHQSWQSRPRTCQEGPITALQVLGSSGPSPAMEPGLLPGSDSVSRASSALSGPASITCTAGGGRGGGQRRRVRRCPAFTAPRGFILPPLLAPCAFPATSQLSAGLLTHSRMFTGCPLWTQP